MELVESKIETLQKQIKNKNIILISFTIAFVILTGAFGILYNSYETLAKQKSYQEQSVDPALQPAQPQDVEVEPLDTTTMDTTRY